MEGTEVVAKTAGDIVAEAGEAVPGLLDIGTKVFNWAIANPFFLLSIIIALLFVGVGIVKKFSR